MTRWMALGVVAVLALAGCSAEADPPPPPAGLDLSTADPADGNGLWLRPGPQTAAIIADAMRVAGPVRVAGTITETLAPDPDDSRSLPRAGRTITLDFAGTATTYAATVTAGDIRFEVVVDGDGTRLRGDDGFARAFPGHVTDTVSCTAGADAVLAEWSPLLDPAALVESLLLSSDVAATAPDGEDDMLEVTIGQEGAVLGVLSVGRFGPPLPRSFVGADLSGEAALTFTDWGVAVDLTAAAASLPCPTP